MRMITRAMAVASTLALLLGVIAGTAGGASSVLTDIEARDDFAGTYVDRERGGLRVYLFTGDAEGAAEALLAHHGDDARFELLTVTYTLDELRAVEEEIADRLEGFEMIEFDIREIGIDVAGNHVDVGVYGSLPPMRQALARYGDKVRVEWSEGAGEGPESSRELTAVKNRNGIRVRITLEGNHLVAGEPMWLRTKVRNLRETPLFYGTDGCEISVDVGGRMLDQNWRPGNPADLEAIEAQGRKHYNDLEWRLENSIAGDETIHLLFVPDWAVGRPRLVCDSIGITHRIAPGAVVEQRMHWNGLASGEVALPPDGLARITGSFAPGRDRPPIEVMLDVPLVAGLAPDWLHPMEAVDAALADPVFRDLIEPVDISKRNQEILRLDTEHDTWLVGVCGAFDGTTGYWKVALVDPVSGEVTEIIDGPVGENCRVGPWLED